MYSQGTTVGTSLVGSILRGACVASLAAALLASCGGGEKSKADSLTLVPSLERTAPQLLPFDEIAGMKSAPATITVGREASTADLEGGARLVVPAGAFAGAGSLQVVSANLALQRLGLRVQSARAYALATPVDAGKLGAPVVLEGPPASVGAAAFELVGGHWQRLPLAPGQKARVEISGFSTRTFAFLDGAADTLNTALTVLEAVQSVRAPTTPGLQKGTETEQRASVDKADAATKAFFGAGETATRPQSEMCDEIRTVLAARKGKTSVKFPRDYGATSYPSLGLFLFEAGTPDGAGYYWDLTSASHAAIEKRILAQDVTKNGRVSLATVLDTAIEANGGDVALGVLAAHNYLKEKAYNGRGQYGGISAGVAGPIGRIETWRRSSSTNPAGEYEKAGPLYHVFAAMAAGVWGPPGLGQTARTGEALLRSFGWGNDTPDVEKGAADQCGAENAAWIGENLTSSDVCVEGSVPLSYVSSVAGKNQYSVTKNQFSVCFPREGGKVEGKIEFGIMSADEDCSGRIDTTIILTGTFTSPRVTGTGEGTVNIELNGVCKSERALFDKSTYTSKLPAWEGTFDGSTLRLKVGVDAEDPTDVITLEGRPK